MAMKKIIFIFLLITMPASAQMLKEDLSEAVTFAEMGGKVAGGAYYCRLGEDALDEFISMAHGKVSTLSVDKVDKIVAQLEFSNNFSAWSARPPMEGCKAFLKDFERRYPELASK